MKKSVLLLVSFIIFSLSLFSQPNLSLWHVDQAHLNDPNTGISYQFPCGNQYYVTTQVVLLNDCKKKEMIMNFLKK